MRKNSSRIIIIAFLCFVPIWMFAVKDKTFSDKENRYLAKFPKLTWSTLTDGTFMDDLETYLADQFPLRNASITLKTNALRATGQKKISGVYMGDNGYLIAEEEEYDRDKVADIVESINNFAHNLNDVKVNMMLVPNSVSIYSNKLPAGVASNQENTINMIYNRLSEDITAIDVYNVFEEHKDYQLYYKTDHHWTVKGAKIAFDEYAKKTGLDTENVNYETYCVSSDFLGTQASNCGVYSSKDMVNICVPENSAGTYVVNYVYETKKTASLFDMDKLETKDKYLVFMGGNYARVDIETNAENDKNLLIIKDSYANCFIPMLTPYYKTITVVDPRYFYDNIYELTDSNKINEVLFLYNVNSFVTDNSLKDILNRFSEKI